MSYGRLNEPKLKEKDYIFSCEKERQELNSFIDEEARRVNIDSAKKRAVLQRMDYEGFRQMVLGAHIFTTKSKELLNFSKGESQEANLNKHFDERKTETSKQMSSYRQNDSQMHCSSFREFKKKFISSYSKEGELQNTLFCYKYFSRKLSLIKQQNEERIRRIFNAECEANILVKIVDVFENVLMRMKEKQAEGVESEAGFMLLFFRMVISIPTMTQMSLLILLKKERQRISEFILEAGKYLKESDLSEQIERVSKLFLK